jgi:twitching motility protein PilT
MMANGLATEETVSPAPATENHAAKDDPLNFLYRILDAVVKADGSDVHLKPNAPIRARIHGALTALDCPWATSSWLKDIIERIVPAQSRERYKQSGQIDFSYYALNIGRFRTNVYHQRGEEAIAMRYVKSQAPMLDELGLPPILKDIALSERGIVLIAGTTGSGKSTTMAAMIEHINQMRAKNIITLEDPIEFMLEDNQCDIKQREVGVDVASFAEGLRGVLRQDPDIILIGEMRDAVSFSAALSAADTGHLVFSTLHVTDAAQGVGRVLDFFKPEEREHVRLQMAGNLRAIICQRMVRKCDGGIVPALEILLNTVTVRKMIEQNRLESLSAAIETGNDDGMQNFNQALLKLVKAKLVSEEEALAKASNPAALEMNLKGIFLSQSTRILGT